MNSILTDTYEEVKTQCTILSFVKKFSIMKCFQEAGIKKREGIQFKGHCYIFDKPGVYP